MFDLLVRYLDAWLGLDWLWGYGGLSFGFVVGLHV